MLDPAHCFVPPPKKPARQQQPKKQPSDSQRKLDRFVVKIQMQKPPLPNQQETTRECDRDASHATECFQSAKGQLWWRCLDPSCQETKGNFAGKPRLLGADGEQQQQQSRKRLVSENSGKYVSLLELAESIGCTHAKIDQVLARLEALETRVCGGSNMFRVIAE
jgi:hypothetical protein